MTWHDAQARRKVTEGGNKGLEKAAAHLLDKAKAVVPVLTSDTKNSGDSGLLRSGTSAVVFTDPVAIALHEDLRHHHAPGKRAKYLEQPLRTESHALLEIIAEGIRGNL